MIDIKVNIASSIQDSCVKGMEGVDKALPDSKRSSNRYNFSLIGKGDEAQLALDGQIVKANFLRMKGFTLEKSKENKGKGENCLRCAPEGDNDLPVWLKVSITCNDLRGDIWLCPRCSKVYERKRCSKSRALWAELTKTW